MKYTMDQTMMPEVMLDIDEAKIQNIEQSVKQFFPDDNSIMNSEDFSLGGESWRRSVIYKDNITFGITSKPEGARFIGQPEQEGLVSYQPIGKHQFWLNFSDN